MMSVHRKRDVASLGDKGAGHRSTLVLENFSTLFGLAKQTGKNFLTPLQLEAPTAL